MATRSYIIAYDEDKNHYTGVYCHWDGYPEYVGVVLKNHYKDKEKIFELISHGALSSLGKEIGEENNFDNRDDDICCFYHRDRRLGIQQARNL